MATTISANANEAKITKTRSSCQDNISKLLTIPPPIRHFIRMKITFFLFLLTICGLNGSARAGVFNIPEFVEYKSWEVGMEPEVTLSTYGNTSTTGISDTAKFTYGITPLSNLQVGMGFGSGSEGFRLGGTYTFDFIPDLEGQLGAGLALQAYYYKLKGAYGQTETTLYPYLHKMFKNNGFQYDPFVAMPIGLAFYNSNYRSIWQLAFGTNFKTSEHFILTGEIGINLKDTDTYISGGITYRD